MSTASSSAASPPAKLALAWYVQYETFEMSLKPTGVANAVQ
jgi:hypothetical protein